ncbi:nSTAND1 domain-containing NTPase [Kutzneria kofuensis]|uniref:nSTAND1 domain-containing NTPase n=1 Tax=Kutzneria kofuensis TaxID=103725 RepID=UPI0035E40628
MDGDAACRAPVGERAAARFRRGTASITDRCGQSALSRVGRAGALFGECSLRRRRRALTEPVVVEDGPCPYVGLSSFQADDAALFFGRERLVRQVGEQLGERRFVGVFGASGAGKSSLLRAGVAASAQWSSLVVVPGPHPFEELAGRLSVPVDELAEHPSNLAMVLRQRDVELLVVDQFEEIFTLCGDEERTRFVAALTHPALRVVIGVRADFYGHCGQYPELVAALDGGQVLVGPLASDELRRAIIRPAAVASCVVEEALVTRLVADVGNQVGALPLLSHALRETWLRRQGISLTLASYEKTGGLQHALAQSAEQTFTSLTPTQRARARQLFLRLVALGCTTWPTRPPSNRWMWSRRRAGR